MTHTPASFGRSLRRGTGTGIVTLAAEASDYNGDRWGLISTSEPPTDRIYVRWNDRTQRWNAINSPEELERAICALADRGLLFDQRGERQVNPHQR